MPFFLKLTFWKNRKLWGIGLLGFFVIFHNPPILKTVGQLFYSTIEIVKDLQGFNHNVNVSHSGEQVLP